MSTRYFYSAVLGLLVANGVCGYVAYRALQPRPFTDEVVKWGTVSIEHNQHVIDTILSSTDCRRAEPMTDELFNVITRRIGESPDLLLPLKMRYFKMTTTPVLCDGWSVVVLIENLQKYYAEGGPHRRGLNLIVLASLFERPDWIAGLTFTGIDERWSEVFAWLEDNKRFIVFDRTYQRFTVDEELRQRDEPAPPERQRTRESEEREAGTPVVDAEFHTIEFSK